jgi:hypothetical protein
MMQIASQMKMNNIRIFTVFEGTERMQNADVTRGEAEGDIALFSRRQSILFILYH